tara:strand:- start:1483 stop:2802 length:1320 start_codon:yes stop_codon:yes gene_type:complete
MSLASSKRWLFFILLVSFGIRFTGLNQIDGPVFDEVFYPNYGLMYLQGEDFYYAHPPLANYLYAFAIWLYSLLPFVGIESIQDIELSSLQPISYRWINALVGSLLCLVIYGISCQLTKNRFFALIASSLVVLDGSLIVDSRIALANTFLLFFGFSGLYFFLRFCLFNHSLRSLVFSGLLIAMAVSIKWSGLGFALLALLIVLFINKNAQTSTKHINLNNALLYTFIIIATYVVIFLPDIFLNSNYGFFEKHQQMLGFHQTMVTADEHPYCSKWYTWPIMMRPVGYFFESTAINQGGIVNSFKDIHLFPNPFIYLLSTLSIALMIIQTFLDLFKKDNKDHQKQLLQIFISLGYLANFLPWAFVERCLFLYHYQAASIFSFLAFAWYLSKLIDSKKLHYQAIFIMAISTMVVSFLYWLPIQMGFEIPDAEFYRRMWFRSWI